MPGGFEAAALAHDHRRSSRNIDINRLSSPSESSTPASSHANKTPGLSRCLVQHRRSHKGTDHTTLNSHKQTRLRSLLVASSPPPLPQGVLRWAGSFACAAPRAAAAAAARSLPSNSQRGDSHLTVVLTVLPRRNCKARKKTKPSGSRHTRHFTPIFLGCAAAADPQSERRRERESLSAEYLNSPELRPWVPRAPSHPRSHRLVLLLLRGAEPARLSPPLVPPTTAPPSSPRPELHTACPDPLPSQH